jgi:hypothetical protein
MFAGRNPTKDILAPSCLAEPQARTQPDVSPMTLYTSVYAIRGYF